MATLVNRMSEERPDRADQSEILSDVLNAEQLILWDSRGGVLRPQVSVYGMTRLDAVGVLRRLADELEDEEHGGVAA